MLIWGPSEPQRCRRPPTLSLYYVGKIKETIFPKLRVQIKDNNNSPQCFKTYFTAMITSSKPFNFIARLLHKLN